MIFYDFALFAPSPWIAWIFAREKGLEPERQVVDLLGRENRREPFISEVNPLGELPAIRLDDGNVITEVTAVCEYLEEQYPMPPLIGTTALERAETRMWVRRIEQKVAGPMGDGFSAEEGREFFEAAKHIPGVVTKSVLPVEAAPLLKAKARESLIWLDGTMKGRTWVCGDRFTLADIYLYCFLQFGENHGQPIPEGTAWLGDFFRRAKARPTAWHGVPGSLD